MTGSRRRKSEGVGARPQVAREIGFCHHRQSHQADWATARRRGASTLDYVLALGVVLPLLAIILPMGRRMIQLVFEMTCTLVAWPFM